MYESISLFSGAMGLDLGLEKAGIEFKVCQDFDPSCYETMLINGKPGMTGDIRAINSETILKRANLKAGEAFLLCGGPPCQPFSTAGKRLGINDPRGSLFMDYVRMVDETRPLLIFRSISVPICAGVLWEKQYVILKITQELVHIFLKKDYAT